MLLRPTRILITATCIVGGIFALLTFHNGGHFPDRSSLATYLFASAITGLTNSILFLIPASVIWLAARRRRPSLCSIAILTWIPCYFGLWYWVFLTADGM